MSDKYEGINQTVLESEYDGILEEYFLTGHTAIHNFFSENIMDEARDRLLEIHKKQIQQFGEQKLRKINEEESIRNVVEFDSFFIDLIKDERIGKIRKDIFKQDNVLSLANANICTPNKKNNMLRWHRDLPYQNFICDETLGLNFFVLIDEFTVENGGTVLLPGSHKTKKLPSESFIEKHGIKTVAPKGSLIIFNSMLFHRAGQNNSTKERIGLNYNFVRPFIKQQYLNTGLDKTLFGDAYQSSENCLKLREKFYEKN